MKYDICVFGGCAIDQMYYKDEEGKIPENPMLILPGGKGSNQAVAAARAGAKVTMISRVGKDNIGNKILQNLTYNNISTNNVEVVEGLINDWSKIIIDEKNKDYDIQRFTGAINSFTKEMVDSYKKVFLKSKLVIAQLKVPKEVSVELINFCYENQIPLIITPCRPEKLSIVKEIENLELLDKITYITANRKECATMFGTDNIEECVTKYPNKLIVTLANEGVIYHDGEKIIKIPAIKVDKVEDTPGAGDTFTGNLAAALVEGYNLEEAIVIAQYAASMKIQVKGAQDGMPYKEELEKYVVNKTLNGHDYMREFNLARASVEEALEVISKKRMFKVKPRTNKQSIFVTESDFLVEKILIDKIREVYPTDNFVTEEFNNENTIQDRTWIIDPIDGTSHYMKNSIFWGVQLAFVDKGEIKFSIISIPNLNEFYYAIRGKGVYLNNKKIEIKNSVPLNESIIEFCGSMYKMEKEKELIFKKILKNDIRPANFMHINTCSFAFANLLSERTNTLIISTVKPWDILPGVFMAQEIGLKSYTIPGLTIYTNTKDIEKFI